MNTTDKPRPYYRLKTRLFHRQCYILIVAAAFTIFAVHLILREDQEKHRMNTEEFFSLIRTTYGSERTIDRFKMEDGGFMNVMDMLLRTKRRFTVMRLVTNTPDHGHSFMYLQIPAELSENNIDTARWKVEHGKLYPNSSEETLTETMFKGEAVEFSRDSKARVLLIGLAGGSISSYLHFYFPKMNITGVELSAQMVHIARKWFGLKTDDRYRVLVADGVKFMEEEVEKGTKYDVVMVDTCVFTPDLHMTFVCPVQSFLETSAIRNMGELTSDRGIFLLNIYTEKLSPSETLATLRPKFSNFDYCNIVRKNDYNQILYCMHTQPVKDKQVNLHEYERRYRTEISGTQ